jgi:hypothetical protein
MFPPPNPDSVVKLPNLERVLAEMAEFLATAPLYRTFKYQGCLWRVQDRSIDFAFPETLRLYCSDGECGRLQIWERTLPPYLGTATKYEASGFASSEFQCRNCERSNVTYFILFNVSEQHGELTKVGQWPPLSREPDPVVVQGWDRQDLLFYRDAMTFRNANKGIAALPYLRRIIENHMRDILALLADANNRQPIPGFDVHHLERVRDSHRFSDKLDFVRDYLPQGLKPAGYPNPIESLYELLSEGLHQESEDECIAIFDRCKVAFEYVVRKLTEAKREDEQYLGALRKLNLEPPQK